MSWDKERIAQIQLPDPADDDPHPRLLLEGYGIHAGQSFTALFPDGWRQGHNRDARGLGRPRADGGPDGSADHRADGAGADDGIL